MLVFQLGNTLKAAKEFLWGSVIGFLLYILIILPVFLSLP